MDISNPSAAAENVATGSYTGNDTDDRQITVGFKCSLVILYDVTTSSKSRICYPGVTFDKIDTQKTDCLLHASDGFIVDHLDVNVSARNYNYWAISE